MSGTSSAWMTVAAAAMSGPTSRVPVVSTVTCTKMGMSLPASRIAVLAALTAALMNSVSWLVSVRIASTPAFTSPRACCVSAASRSSYLMWPRLGSLVPGPMSPMT